MVWERFERCHIKISIVIARNKSPSFLLALHKRLFRCWNPAFPESGWFSVRVTISRMKFRLTAIMSSLVLLSSLALGADNPDFTVKKLADGVYAAVSGDGSKAGSNAGFIIGSNSVLVVDTFEDVAPARELLAEIRKVTKLPIRFVVNTHYHLDHTGRKCGFCSGGCHHCCPAKPAWLAEY